MWCICYANALHAVIIFIGNPKTQRFTQRKNGGTMFNYLLLNRGFKNHLDQFSTLQRQIIMKQVKTSVVPTGFLRFQNHLRNK